MQHLALAEAAAATATAAAATATAAAAAVALALLLLATVEVAHDRAHVGIGEPPRCRVEEQRVHEAFQGALQPEWVLWLQPLEPHAVVIPPVRQGTGLPEALKIGLRSCLRWLRRDSVFTLTREQVVIRHEAVPAVWQPHMHPARLSLSSDRHGLSSA